MLRFTDIREVSPFLQALPLFQPRLFFLFLLLFPFFLLLVLFLIFLPISRYLIRFLIHILHSIIHHSALNDRQE